MDAAPLVGKWELPAPRGSPWRLRPRVAVAATRYPLTAVTARPGNAQKRPDGTTVTRTGMLVPGCWAVVVTYSRPP